MIVWEECRTCNGSGFYGLDSQANFLVCRDCYGAGGGWTDRMAIIKGKPE